MMEKETFEWIINFIVYPACAVLATICLCVIADSLDKIKT